MIQGLKVTVKSLEVRQLCLAQAEYHLHRAAAHQRVYDTLKEAGVESSSDAKAGYSTSNNPKDEARTKVRTHSDQASYLQFIAEHLTSGEEYQLDRADLALLGIVRGGMF